jgi:hypothetical protein
MGSDREVAYAMQYLGPGEECWSLDYVLSLAASIAPTFMKRCLRNIPLLCPRNGKSKSGACLPPYLYLYLTGGKYSTTLVLAWVITWQERLAYLSWASQRPAGMTWAPSVLELRCT